MKSLQAQFSSCQLLMLCSASASTKTCSSITSAVLIRIWPLVFLTLVKNKPNNSRKSRSVPYMTVDCQSGPDFHWYLGFLCLPTATTMEMRFWETGHKKTIKKVNFPYRCCLVFILPNEQHVKFFQGK